MSHSANRQSDAFEIGKLYADRSDYHLAMPKLIEAANQAFAQRDFAHYLQCQNLLLRIYAEQERFDEIQTTKELLQDLVLKEGFELNAKTYYTLALCASYKNQTDSALEYLQKSLAIALATDKKDDICYAIIGLAICYKRLGKMPEALKEIYNLQVFFQVLDIPEIKIASQMLNAQIFYETGRTDQALEILWQTYDLVKELKNLFMHISLLYHMGCAYAAAGDKEMARTHLKLASHLCDPKNLKVLSRRIQQMLNELGVDARENYDMVFDVENHAITEKKLGRIDFKNQFILLDLLKLFVKNQGQVYSKEHLVESVWKQPYDPAVHDNKIYVTIKRLRKMIEPDYDKPKYIFRAKNGYYMNKTAKVYIESRRSNET
jgi:tetratricopeptide (TPR) repeat protein